jgi:hypothetical protein
MRQKSGIRSQESGVKSPKPEAGIKNLEFAVT